MDGDKSIVSYIEERLEKDGVELPIFDKVAYKLQGILAKENYSTDDLARIIRTDQSLASRILKTANSAFYTGLNPTTTIEGAIVRLGIKSLINIVMMVAQKNSYNSLKKEYHRWMTPLWVHSLGVAVASRWLAEHLGLMKFIEESFLAGLLHDIGKLLLLKIIEELQSSNTIGVEISDSVIYDVFDTLHCSQGEKLMRHLNMPEDYCSIVLRHDSNEDNSGNKVLINLIKLANLTCHKMGIGLKNEPDIMLSATNEAISLMASDLLLAELQVELEEYMATFENMLV